MSPKLSTDDSECPLKQSVIVGAPLNVQSQSAGAVPCDPVNDEMLKHELKF